MIENFTANTIPLWIDTAPGRHFQTLEGSISVDVAIIGAGITGITAADLLKRAGKTVAVVDLGRVGHGETGHTTAHLTEVLDIDFKDLIANFGLEGARLACQSSRKAIQRIEANIADYAISCGFKRVPGYKYTERSEDVDYLEDEAEAAFQLSIPNELTYEAPLPFPIARAMRVEHQAQFHPLEYLQRLAEAIPGDGSYIFENTRMVDVEEGDVCRVITDRGVIVAPQVIVAANVPVLNRFFMHTKIAPFRTYAVAARLRRPWPGQALFWDTDEPYHYIRKHNVNGVDYVIIGGEDHKTGQEQATHNVFHKLEQYARARFEIDDFPYRWSGQIIEPVDGLPYIGRNPLSDNVYVATGYSGTGMTFGTVAGMLLTDLILDNPNPWADLYDARRFKPIASAKKYLSHNVDYPSHLISDRITPAQETLPNLRENEGALIRVGGKKVAAYRDPEGEMHMLSPVCPHLGCYVHWNDAEKSWDCPCHGSRFSPTGKVLNGPAVADLASETYDEKLPYATVPYDTHEERPIGPLGAPLLSLFQCPLKGPSTT